MNTTRRQFGLGAATLIATPGLISCGRPELPVIEVTVSAPEAPPPPLPTADTRFPLRRHVSGRFLTDAVSQPFFLHADTPWSIAVQLTRAQVDTYLDDRKQRGFNAVLFNAIEHYFSGNRPYFRNAEGQDPFEPMTRFSAPNPAYWSMVDHVVAGCERRGIACLLAPAYLGYGGGTGRPDDQGWDTEVSAASNDELQAYGRFLANRYARRNVIWVLGGDHDPPDPTKQWNIALGIRIVDPDALVTGHGARGTESYEIWRDQPGWNLNNIYISTDGIAQPAAEDAYRRPGPVPFFLIEGAYGNKQSDDACRLQVYQSLLGGACGHCFGTFPLWGFGEPNANGGAGPTAALASSLSTPATQQIAHARRHFNSYPWWNLVPANGAGLVRRNRLAGTRRICGALASDRKLAMIWTAGDRFSVDLAALSGQTIRLSWFDSVNGEYWSVSPAQLTNEGTLNFLAPGEGVLVLQAI